MGLLCFPSFHSDIEFAGNDIIRSRIEYVYTFDAHCSKYWEMFTIIYILTMFFNPLAIVYRFNYIRLRTYNDITTDFLEIAFES